MTDSASESFTKHLKRIQKFKDRGDLNYLYKSELDNASFADDTAYSDNKNLAKRTISDKILKDKAYKIALDRKYNRYQRELARMVYKFFDIKTGLGANVNKELAQELQKPLIKKFTKTKVYARF